MVVKQTWRHCTAAPHLQRSRCHVGTFLYVSLAVTSNMIMAHCPCMLHHNSTIENSQKKIPNMSSYTTEAFTKMRTAEKASDRGMDLLVTITKTSKLLLASCVPAVKTNATTVCKEVEGMHFNTNGGCKTTFMPDDKPLLLHRCFKSSNR